MDDPHAAPATASGGLDDHRVADAPGDIQRALRIVREWAIRAGHSGYAGFLHGVNGRYLVTHQADGVSPRADKDEAAFLHLLREVGVLCQKPVARVNGACIGNLGGADDGRYVEVARSRGRRADTD